MSRQELEAGTYKRKERGDTSFLMLPFASSATFLMQPRPVSLRIVPPTVDWAPLYQFNNQENTPTDVATGVFFPDDFSLCHTDED